MIETRATTYDVAAIRGDFPLLQREVNGHRVAYLDSAATSQKPQRVLDAVDAYYRESNANVHRGVHTLGTEATDIFENSRARVARFIDADPRGVVFVRNTTEAINLVAQSYARELLHAGDRVVVSRMEHHSNLVPWQLAAQRAGLVVEAIALTPDGRLDMDDARRLLQGNVKLLAVTHQSNVLGTINDVATLTRMAHDAGALVLVDAAQSVPHMPVSVREIGSDFLAFSGHKMCAPMGAGVLWARPELLEAMPPFLGGGSMIETVSLERSTWAEIPHKFEAGTPDVASVAGLAAACDYLDDIGRDAIAAHEEAMTQRLLDVLAAAGATIHGPASLKSRGGCVSFSLGEIHAHDTGTLLDRLGVEVRAGHHCCQPLMRSLGVPATTRASVYLYTDVQEIDALGEGLLEVRRVFG